MSKQPEKSEEEIKKLGQMIEQLLPRIRALKIVVTMLLADKLGQDTDGPNRSQQEADRRNIRGIQPTRQGCNGLERRDRFDRARRGAVRFRPLGEMTLG